MKEKFADLEDLCQYVDVIKLPGRRTGHSLDDGLTYNETFGKQDGPLLVNAPEAFVRLVEGEARKPELEAWRRGIKACRYQCWNCNICTAVSSGLTF